MFIPRYWHRIDSEAETPKGKRVYFTCSRGSIVSLADAKRLATEAMQRIALRIRNGEGFPQRYAYGDRPLKEEIVEAIPAGPDVLLEAAITRNGYGALVLNTARVCFIDVDIPPPPLGPFVRGLWHWLRGRGWPKPNQLESEALDRLRAWVKAHPEWGVRVYRTNAGFRYLVTHDVIPALNAEIESTMQFLGADPFYVRLCKAQRSYRARLTPKPWRCYIDRPTVSFPWRDAAAESAMRDWERRYAEAANDYATCALVETLGQPLVHPEIVRWVELHDRHTRVASGLPLA
jgi:hypothetical protein